MFSIYANDNLVYSDTYPNFNRKVTSPQFKMEVDAAGSLDFVVNVENSCYNDIQKMRTKIEVRRFDKPIWVGRVVEETVDFDNNKKLHCEGSYAFLNDTCQPIREFKNKTLSEIVTTILNTHNERYTSEIDAFRRVYFGGQSVIEADGSVERKIEYFATAYDYTIDAIKTILEKYECHCMIRMVQDTVSGEWQNRLFLFKEYWDHSGQIIQFGKNLMDFTKKYNFSKIVTRLLPLAKTDRESPDEPVAIGTTLDLTTPQDYDPTIGYGVLVTTSKNYVVDIYSGKLEPLKKNYKPSVKQYTYNQSVHGSGYVGSYDSDTVIGYQHLPSPNGGRINGKLLNLRRYYDQETETYKYEPFTFIKMGENGGYTIPDYVNIFPNSSFSMVLNTAWGDNRRDAYPDTFWPWTHYCLYHRPLLTDSLSDFSEGSPASGDLNHNYPYAGTKFSNSAYNHTIDWAKPLWYSFKNTGDGVKYNYYFSCHDTIKNALYDLNQGCILPYRDVYKYGTNLSYSEPSTVTVIELDASKYKYFYLSAARTSYKVWGSDSVSNPLVTIFKCKKNRNIWGDFKGYDDDGDRENAIYFGYRANETKQVEEPQTVEGCEYWIFGNFSGNRIDPYVVSVDANIRNVEGWNNNYMVLARVSIGRVFPDPETDECNECMGFEQGSSNGRLFYRGPFDWLAFYTEESSESGGEYLHDCYAWNGPLKVDHDSNITTLDPDTYDFHKTIDVSRCYETKIDIGLSKEDLENYDRVLVVICSKTAPSVNLITDEEAAQIITIGANTNSVPVDKQCPERNKYNDSGSWIPNTSPGAPGVDDIFDTAVGYGLMTPTDLGTNNASWYGYETYNAYRLMNQSEFLYVRSAHESDPTNNSDVTLNIIENGEVHTDAQGLIPEDALIKRTSLEVDINTDKHWDKYRITVYIVPASYEYTNENNELVKEPSSVYLTTEMYGKSGTYAVFSMWHNNQNGTQDPGTWTNYGHSRRLEAIEYGKYINGITKYDKKKIQMPFSKIQGAYCILVVGSYNTSPQLYMHDIEEQTKSSYITVASVNNGDIYVDSRSNNLFITDFEYGNIDPITGQDSFIYETDKMRTTDDIVIQSTGFYNISTASDDLIVTIYIYEYRNDKKVLISTSSYQNFTNSKSIGFINSGSIIRAVFSKRSSDFIELKDIDQFMLYMLDNDVNVNKLAMAKVYVDDNEVVIDTEAAIPAGEPQDADDVWNYRDRVLVNPEPIDVSNKPRLVYLNGIMADYISSSMILSPPEAYNGYAIVYKLFIVEEYEENGEIKEKVTVSQIGLLPDTYLIPDTAKQLYVAMYIMREYYDSEQEQRVFEYKKIGLNDISLSVVTRNPTKTRYQTPSGALDTYGVIEKKVEFDDANTPSELYDRAMDYLYAAQFNDMQLSVSAIDLELLVPSMPMEEVISLAVGESIRVVSWPHSLNRFFSISQISVNLDDASSMKFTLGFSNSDSLAKLFNKKRKD